MPETLVTLPPAAAAWLAAQEPRHPWRQALAPSIHSPAFFAADPPGRRLGSGGGTVHLLWRAWLDFGQDACPEGPVAWLGQGPQRLVLHAGGESRRLPAYAALGKALLPLPNLGHDHPQTFGQVLAGHQIPRYQRALEEAGPACRLLLASGDVWLDFNPQDIPPLTSDITGIGMRVSPETAAHFGVFFSSQGNGLTEREPRPVASFLQKPDPGEIHRRLRDQECFVDTGLWFFSSSALAFLFRLCGWDDARRSFATKDGLPRTLDLYSELGPHLGQDAKPPSSRLFKGWTSLGRSVLPLHRARFVHLGTSRQLFEAVGEIARQAPGQAHRYFIHSEGHASSGTEIPFVWLDSCAGRPVALAGHNLVTGLPPDHQLHSLPRFLCLDTLPIKDAGHVIRAYHLDDTFRGSPRQGALICGQPATRWLEARKALDSWQDDDVFTLPIYPLVPSDGLTQDWIDGFTAPSPSQAWIERWLSAARISAAEIPSRVDFDRYYDHRQACASTYLRHILDGLGHGRQLTPDTRDLDALARYCRDQAPGLKRLLLRRSSTILTAASQAQDRSRLLFLLSRVTSGRRQSTYINHGFQTLREAILNGSGNDRVSPVLKLKADQIVWARSPVRLDLAGGWTDTPPYCFEHGGAVLNLAVNLNGQPPIQVFVRPVSTPCLRIRSIDLGSSETILDFQTLAGFRDPHSGFSLPKAALALAGFHPDFARDRPPCTLRKLLQQLGGGLELSLLCAVPKGSGLGTSSILAATLLAALNRACGLGWDTIALYRKVLTMEQLLTTGGGWQDQAGALFPGIKLIETQPGLSQHPIVRYLPETLFEPEAGGSRFLLYYTGITRLAKGILQQIVHDMFLGRCETFRLLEDIRSNAHQIHRAIQLGDAGELNRCIARSWRCNRRLDAGTTSPRIERMITACGPGLEACKLLGAGGGGYLFMAARDPAAAHAIRRRLEADPPNPLARFVDFSVSRTGLQVTVS
ncbi:MAG: hypothetical protein EA425_06690 [Puniceicoccaceae bacterium]|nr:MAG: hypothetical protein EA425_06690 [Puniceicoccaceae bacterium]